MTHIKDWLAEALNEREGLPLAAEEASEFCMLAGVLRAQAQAQGFDACQLEDLCGGDIPGYLLRRHMVVEGPVLAYALAG